MKSWFLSAALLLAASTAVEAEELARMFYRSGAVQPCASCHGLMGEGKREGGVVVPPLQQLRGYDSVSLARLLAQGIARDGRHVQVMPRYMLQASQVSPLLGYLQSLGSEADSDPGITASQITLGAILPLTGAEAASGNRMYQHMLALVEESNNKGGIFGRRIRLMVFDAAVASPPDLAQVFALIATAPQYQRGDVPLVGALAASPSNMQHGNAPIFYLLPDNVAMLRQLLAHVGQQDVGLFIANTATRLTLEALARCGRTLNRAHFVERLSAVEPRVISSQSTGNIEISFPRGSHMARTTLLSSN